MSNKSKPTVHAQQSAARTMKKAAVSAYVPPKVQKSRKLAQVTGQPPITAPG